MSKRQEWPGDLTHYSAWDRIMDERRSENAARQTLAAHPSSSLAATKQDVAQEDGEGK